MTTQNDSKSSPLPNATASGLMTMTYERLPWIDCFNQPSIKQLKSSLGDEPSALFDLVNSKLAKIEGVTRATMYWRVHQARQQLKTRLDAYYED